MIRHAQKDNSDSSHAETFGGFYDVLLDMRMQQQEVLADVNKLPQNAAYMEFRKELGNRFTTSVDKADKNLCALLNNMLKVHKIFTKHDGISRKLSGTKSGKVGNNNADDEEIVSDEDDEMADGEDNLKEDGDEEEDVDEDEDEEVDENDEEEDEVDGDSELDDGNPDNDDSEKEGDDDIEKIKGGSSNVEHIFRKIKENYSSFEPLKHKIITELSDKVNLSTLKTKSNFQPFHIPVVKQIKQILQDRSRLIERTRLKRSTYKILGKQPDNDKNNKNCNNSNIDDVNDRTNNMSITDDEPDDRDQTLPVRKVEEERDDEIFDDGDFYQHILVEMTNRKNRNSKDMMAISKQWAELNKLRKTKKQIDQRASKGRKTRYNIHKKLVDFIAPVKNNSTWSDPKRDALFKELFKDNVRVVDTGSNWMFGVLS